MSVMSEVPKDLEVVGIVGTSFSGSTVLNLMLGAHPSIYAGGELSALILGRGDETVAACSACGFACPYWDETARNAVTKANLYRIIESRFDQRVIVDSSKSIEWFHEVLASEAHRGIAARYILMVKHPIRWVASCLANVTLHEPRQGAGGLLGRLLPSAKRRAFIEEQVNDLAAHYDQLLPQLESARSAGRYHRVHYERFVADSRAAVEPVLQALGLTYVPAMADFSKATYHQIAGNAGPLFQAGQGWPKGTKPNAVRKKFYEAGAGLRIDDKYQELMSDKEIAWLLSHPVLRDLGPRLGYDDPTMPFPIR
jgi:hypothetical protein